jgi:BirA family biotin operon repressor/biotin-[acetyl-CoA-carboxylase] ligase
VLPFWPERVGWVALAAGLSAAQAVRDLGAEAGVKWPNDVTLQGKKLAGVLAETSVPDLVAIGIGMNVTNPLPEDPVLAARCARLADPLPEVTLDTMLEALLARLGENWGALEAGGVSGLHQAWSALDTTAGRPLRWSEQGLTGTALGIDEAGRLRLRCTDGREITASVGEVGFLD